MGLHTMLENKKRQQGDEPVKKRERHVDPRRISLPYDQNAVQTHNERTPKWRSPKSASQVHDVPFRGTLDST
jgi:hypothetical protein